MNKKLMQIKKKKKSTYWASEKEIVSRLYLLKAC